MKITLRTVLLAGAALLFCMPCLDSAKAQKSAPGASTGTAIGNGVKAFLSALFPSGSAVVSEIQGWLTKKPLNDQQQSQIKAGADNKKSAQQVSDPNVTKAIGDLQAAAKTLELTSIVLYRTNNINAEASVLISKLKDSSQGQISAAELDDLTPTLNDLNSDLTGLNQGGTLQNERAAVTDLAVSDALLALDRATGGPSATVNQSLKEKGNRANVVNALTQIQAAATQFNNLGVLLLGSTGMSITSNLNDFKKAGGSATLEDLTQQTITSAEGKLAAK